MTSLGNILLSAHAMYVTLIASCFFIIVLGADDELHQYAVNSAMKISAAITILSLLGYSFYKLVSGNGTVSIHVIFFAVEVFSILTFLLYYLELKGFSFSLKIKSKKVSVFFTIISIAISVSTTLSIFFKFKLFANPGGIIRYDELLLFINFLLLSLIIPLFPNIRQKLNREEYKKREKELNKTFNIFTAVYLLVYLLALIGYIIYRKATL